MSDTMPALLAATLLLDVQHPDTKALAARLGWRTLHTCDRVGAAYDFVHDEIAFGCNEGEAMPASRVLADVIGPCNSKRKRTLPMALLRAVGIPRRVHGFTIDKPSQKGAITGLACGLAPQRISATMPESVSRLRLKRGAHRLSAQMEGRAVDIRVRGRAGDLRDVEPVGSGGVWGTGFSRAAVHSDEVQSQARASKLVVDLDLRR